MPSMNVLVKIVVSVAVIIGMYLFYQHLSPAGNLQAIPVPSEGTNMPVTSKTVIEVKADVVQVEIKIVAGQRVAGPETVNAIQGQWVHFKILSDQGDALHLHGYDLELPLLPNIPAQMELFAEHAGRFDYELHANEAVIGTLIVQPQ